MLHYISENFGYNEDTEAIKMIKQHSTPTPGIIPIIEDKLEKAEKSEREELIDNPDAFEDAHRNPFDPFRP